MGRQQPANSITAAVRAAQAVAGGDIEPPASVKLTAIDVPYWVAVTRSRARDEWSEADLIHAANMARCMRQIEAEQGLLDEEGSIIRNDKGTPIMNPRQSVLRELSGRAMALTRILGMSAASKTDKRDTAQGRKLERKARETAAELQSEADLLA